MSLTNLKAADIIKADNLQASAIPTASSAATSELGTASDQRHIANGTIRVNTTGAILSNSTLREGLGTVPASGSQPATHTMSFEPSGTQMASTVRMPLPMATSQGPVNISNLLTSTSQGSSPLAGNMTQIDRERVVIDDLLEWLSKVST